MRAVAIAFSSDMACMCWQLVRKRKNSRVLLKRLCECLVASGLLQLHSSPDVGAQYTRLLPAAAQFSAAACHGYSCFSPFL